MSAQPAVRRGRPPATVDQDLLLAAALDVFAEGGFASARVEDVAERMGISKPLLFRRFATKDKLYQWCVRAEVRRLTEHLFSAYDAAAEASTADLLRAGMDALIGYALAHPSGFRLLFLTGHHVGEDDLPPVEEVRVAVTERIEEIVRARLEAAGQPAGRSAGVLAASIVGLAEHVARHCLDRPALEPAAVSELASQILAFGMYGLKPEALAEVDLPMR